MITILISFGLGFVSGIFKDAIAEKAKAVYVKYSAK